jgi:NAD-dependent SIR2 family protein deacetylase
MTPAAEKVVLFLGSGFSKELGLPTSGELQNNFLELDFDPGSDLDREMFISKLLGDFWRDVFGWTPSRPRPALEDHFTQIDLAANSGHYLGRTLRTKKASCTEANDDPPRISTPG